MPIACSVAHLSPAEWRLHPKRRRVVVWLSEHPEQVFDTIEALLSLTGSASREEFGQWFKVVPTKRSSPEELAQLIEAVNALFSWVNDRGVTVKPLIVWDTAAATIDVDNENDNSTISKAIALSKQALNDGALWVITHTPKANKNATDASQTTIRGGSAYEGDANCTAYLLKGADGRRFLQLGKIRFKPEFTEIHFDTTALTQTIVDDFDEQEIEKTVVSGLPFPGSKESRRQEKKDLHRAAQRDQVLQAAHAAAKAGLFNGRNELYDRSRPMDRNVCYGLINSMVADGTLIEEKVPPDIRRALDLHPSKTVVFVPASVDLQDYFRRLVPDKTCESGFHTSAPDFVKSEGGSV